MALLNLTGNALIQFVFGEVPAWICEQCDAIYFEEADVAVVQGEIERADAKWAQLFAATTDEQWAKLAEFARQDANADSDMPLDDFLKRVSA